MKKITLLIISALSSLTLISCSADKNSSYTNSNEIFNNWYDVTMEDSAIYHDAARNATIIDYETMETSLLCHIPNCSHSNSECLVNILKNSSQLPIIYNNCAYYFINFSSYKEVDGKTTLDLKTQVQKYDFNNRTITNVAEIEGANANDSGGCYLIGSDYYFTTNYGNPTYDELGNVSSSKGGGGGNLFSVNLENGKITDYGEIFDYEKLKTTYPAARNSTSMYLMGKIDNELYIRVSYVKDEVTDEMMMNGINPLWYGSTYSFDLNTHEFEKRDDTFSLCYMNGYHVYLSENSDSKLMIENIETGEVYDGPETFAYNAITVFDDKLWYESKCYDIKSGTEKMISDLDYAHVIAKYKDDYIIKGEGSNSQPKFEKLSKDSIAN